MDTILAMEIPWLVALQSLGDWLTLPMQFFTFLGREEFYILALPALYWCLDTGLGLRVGVILLLGGGINDFFKLAFHGPRPYWLSRSVKALSSEVSFGIPSGHAFNAVTVWGTVAAYLRKGWGWAIPLMFLIGISRLYLGVHFLSDVLLGWLLGALGLWVFLRLWEPLVAWARERGAGEQVLGAFVLSLIPLALNAIPFLWLRANWQLPSTWLENAAFAGADAPAPVTLSGVLTSSGALFGLLVGMVWSVRRGKFQVGGSVWQRLARYLLGLIGVLILYLGLKAVFPAGEGILPYAFRYLRYALLGAWITGGAPWLFRRLRLTKQDDLQSI